VFLWDPQLFDARNPAFKAAPMLASSEPRWIRQYFVVSANGAQQVFDSRESRQTRLDLVQSEAPGGLEKGLHEEITFRHWATFTGDPLGTRALLFPYGLTGHPMRPERYAYYRSANRYSRSVAAPYGLVDLRTGAIERLIDAPHPQFDANKGGGDPLWAPDGKSVVVYTLLPIEADEAVAGMPPQWVEVDIATRQVRPLAAPLGWSVVSWDSAGTGLILTRGQNVGLLSKKRSGDWGDFREIGTIAGLSVGQAVATNGRLVIGVKEAALSPPELVAFDLSTQATTTLTDLNPQLRSLRYGAVEPFSLSDHASGFLIKPVTFMPGVRYPLVILLDDGTLKEKDSPYLLDAVGQLSGHAIQMLAARDFLVLYSREPRGLMSRGAETTEGERMRQHIESAVALLDRQGLVDPARVGISGWSRAAYHTDYLLIHSSVHFAAASQIDGGAREYVDRRPFSDQELLRIRTPLLLQTHGLSSLVAMSAMADRLHALNRPTEILHFPSASHSTTRPRHRFRSLDAHIDWWRFWLKDEEDQAPAKRAQYVHWRALRQMRDQVMRCCGDSASNERESAQ
jgi:dienelactone hydrolase